MNFARSTPPSTEKWIAMARDSVCALRLAYVIANSPTGAFVREAGDGSARAEIAGVLARAAEFHSVMSELAAEAERRLIEGR